MKKKYSFLIVIFLIVASCAAFSRIVGNDFINYDDNIYITENSHIKSGINAERIKWAFTSVVVSNWHPITLISHMLDWSLFGAYASGHHIVSLLLHIGAVILLFLFLNKTTNTIWPAAFAAAFFALHPLRVESVAWAAERKDVLSMFFGLAGIYAYACYAENFKLSKYFLCLVLFALSLMSKSMMVTLPFVLLLLDYWPLGRWQKAIAAPVESRFKLACRLVWEKTPFFLLTVALSFATIWAHNKSSAIIAMENLPFSERLSNAIFSYIAYLGKIFYPVKLAVFYPYQFSLPLWKVIFSAIILITITFAVLYYIKRLPFLFVGWFWYLGTLLPVIGLVQVGNQAMADRYSYLPSIGIALMLAWGIPLLFHKFEIRKKILFSVAIGVLCILVVSTWVQCGYWKNSTTLFRHVLQVTMDNYLAHNNLGFALIAEGKIEEAFYHYNKSIGIKPDYVLPYNNRGSAYFNLGNYQRAIDEFNKAIYLKADYADAYYNRGTVYANLGNYQHAIDDFNKAIRLKPDDADAYSNRGTVYLNQGNNKLGCFDAQKACELGNCRALDFAKGKSLCR